VYFDYDVLTINKISLLIIMVDSEHCTRSPGESVNRPRYTVNLYVLLFLFFYARHILSELNDELADDFGRIMPIPGYQSLFNAFVLMLVSGGTIGVEVSTVPLRKKARDLFANFLRDTRLVYIGIHDIKLTNVTGVLHPVDNFLKHIYDRNFPRQAAIAFSTYKRTNPTLDLRLNQLEKYAEPHVESIPVKELELQMDQLLDEVFSSEGFSDFASQAIESVKFRNFESLNIDYSSASGYPFRQGRKKREDKFEAEQAAVHMLDDDCAFDSYVSSHAWYTTGRAKLQEVADPDAGRLIIYAGYSYLLMAMLSLQYWCHFMNSTMDWCGVGFSWMHDGAGKFARHFDADCGFAPKGFRYVSLDISGWDNKLHHSLMMLLKPFYCRLFSKVGLPQNYVEKLCKLVHAMVEAFVLFPMGHCFKLTQGMKSGWAATANDNTLLHELVMRAIMSRVGFLKHVLYGDDNFMLVPDHVTDETLVCEYARFGLAVKYIHSSRCISDVDFLSKHIIYRDGNYYVFREAVETHARLLMPEEMDPRRRDRPDPVIAVERVLGHLLDNPFNGDVRRTCISILERLRDHYEVDYIQVHDGLIRQHPWRNFDVSMIPKKFPTVPSFGFIEALYGVPIVRNLRVVWPKSPDFIIYSGVQSYDATLYKAAADFVNDVHFQLDNVAKRKARSIVKRISPYKQPNRCYGFHAARFEFAIKKFGIRFDTLLDLGSHPGACAASATKYCSSVVCVSMKPDRDKRAFCPYIARGSDVHCIQANADHFVPRRHFDLQHDDVDIVGVRSVADDIEIGLGMIRRARMNHKWVYQALFTLKEVNWHTTEDLYDLYKEYGHIDFVKPLFSNPWKSEFMVYVRKEKTPRMRKSVFVRQYYGFLNSMGPQLFKWGELLLNAISDFRGAEFIEPNINQTDSFEEDWLLPWDRGPEHVTLNECSPIGAKAHLTDLDEVSSVVCQPSY